MIKFSKASLREGELFSEETKKAHCLFENRVRVTKEKVGQNTWLQRRMLSATNMIDNLNHNHT